MKKKIDEVCQKTDIEINIENIKTDLFNDFKFNTIVSLTSSLNNEEFISQIDKITPYLDDIENNIDEMSCYGFTINELYNTNLDALLTKVQKIKYKLLKIMTE